jgi:hypothetical protein
MKALSNWLVVMAFGAICGMATSDVLSQSDGTRQYLVCPNIPRGPNCAQGIGCPVPKQCDDPGPAKPGDPPNMNCKCL